MRAPVLLLAAALAAGCATPPVRYAVPPGGTRAALAEDLAACEDEALVVRDTAERALRVQHCMGDLGYGLERGG